MKKRPSEGRTFDKSVRNEVGGKHRQPDNENRALNWSIEHRILEKPGECNFADRRTLCRICKLKQMKQVSREKSRKQHKKDKNELIQIMKPICWISPSYLNLFDLGRGILSLISSVDLCSTCTIFLYRSNISDCVLTTKKVRLPLLSVLLLGSVLFPWRIVNCEIPNYNDKILANFFPSHRNFLLLPN